MPDDHHPLMPRRNLEDVDLAAIKVDLKFIIEQQARTHKEQVLKPLYIMVGSAGPLSPGSSFSGVFAYRLSAHRVVSVFPLLSVAHRPWELVSAHGVRSAPTSPGAWGTADTGRY
jgi:hypothetical protein